MSDYLNAKTENVQNFLDKYLKKQKQELIEEFLSDLKEFELKRYSDMIRTLKNIREKYEQRLKE